MQTTRRTTVQLTAFALALQGITLSACGGGSGWTPETSGTTSSLDYVWGTSASDVWAVGRAGTILHSDGTRWTPARSPVSYRLRRLHGSSASDVWAVGDQGTIVRYDGATWSSAVSPTTSGLQDVWSFGPDDVWLVADTRVYHWDGRAWADQQIDGTFEYVWASSPRDIWLVQSLGDFAHWDGTRWTAVPSGSSGVNLWYGIWGSGASDVWVVGTALGNDASIVIRWNGSRWIPTSMPWGVNGTGSLMGIGGSGPSDVWAVGTFGTSVHWDGAAWSVVSSENTHGPLYNSVWAASPTVVWAVADNGIITRRF